MLKHPKDFTMDEVALWLVAAGFGDKEAAFRESRVDGALLVTLVADDFKELGFTGLQGKKLLQSLEFSKSLAEGGGDAGGGDSDKIKALEEENASLKAELAKYKPSPQSNAPPPPAATSAPVPTKAPAPVAAPKPEHHVIKGAAGGAVKGVVVGTIAGAIAGDAKQGAKIGAATGAAAGGMNGLGAARRARLARR